VRVIVFDIVGGGNQLYSSRLGFYHLGTMEDELNETASSLLHLLHQDQDFGQLTSLLGTDDSIISAGTPTSYYSSFPNSEHASYAPTPNFTFLEEDADEDQEGSEGEQHEPYQTSVRASDRDPYYGQAGDFEVDYDEDVIPGNME
jgi:hypothetical protein